MSARFPKGDKIATLIFRGIIFCLGVLLLVVFIRIWSTGDFRRFGICCALISLFIGYGIGGDIWGARLFDWFTGRASRRQVEQNCDRASNVLRLFLLVILLALFSLFVFSLYLRYRT
jgi:hypothetical protein